MRHDYELMVGSHGRVEDGVNRIYKPRRVELDGTIRKGDVIKLTEEEAALFGDRVKLISGQLVTTIVPLEEAEVDEDEVEKVIEETVEVVEEVADVIEEIADETADEPPDLSYLGDLTFKDALEVVKSLETIEELQAAYNAEVGGRNRKTLLTRLERMIAASLE